MTADILCICNVIIPAKHSCVYVWVMIYYSKQIMGISIFSEKLKKSLWYFTLLLTILLIIIKDLFCRYI